VEYLSAIWVQPETPTLRQEVPSAHTDAPDDLQETPNNLQETHGDMTFSWRDLPFDEEADAHVEAHFCGRGSSDKDPAKPSRAVLLQLLLKEKVASGRLVIDRIDDGIPILIRGRVPGDAHPDDTSQSQMQSQS
jgi:hypothetical protein